MDLEPRPTDAGRHRRPRNIITECIDWYHVENGIWTLSTLPTTWSKHRQISWRKRALKALHRGDIETVIQLLGELRLKSNKIADGEAVPREDFFIKNTSRLRYDRMRALKLPEGSGAIESVIRRVVNLRLKGNSKYWNEENAQHTMFLRAQLRTGRASRASCGGHALSKPRFGSRRIVHASNSFTTSPKRSKMPHELPSKGVQSPTNCLHALLVIDGNFGDEFIYHSFIHTSATHKESRMAKDCVMRL